MLLVVYVHIRRTERLRVRSNRPQEDTQLIFVVFEFAHATGDQSLAKDTAHLLLDVDPFIPKPIDSVDEPAWQALVRVPPPR